MIKEKASRTQRDSAPRLMAIYVKAAERKSSFLKFHHSFSLSLLLSYTVSIIIIKTVLITHLNLPLIHLLQLRPFFTNKPPHSLCPSSQRKNSSS